jgi:hypothetical protein
MLDPGLNPDALRDLLYINKNRQQTRDIRQKRALQMKQKLIRGDLIIKGRKVKGHFVFHFQLSWQLLTKSKGTLCIPFPTKLATTDLDTVVLGDLQAFLFWNLPALLSRLIPTLKHSYELTILSFNAPGHKTLKIGRTFFFLGGGGWGVAYFTLFL